VTIPGQSSSQIVEIGRHVRLDLEPEFVEQVEGQNPSLETKYQSGNRKEDRRDYRKMGQSPPRYRTSQTTTSLKAATTLSYHATRILGSKLTDDEKPVKSP
jgi:hypothetical protein